MRKISEYGCFPLLHITSYIGIICLILLVLIHPSDTNTVTSNDKLLERKSRLYRKESKHKHTEI